MVFDKTAVQYVIWQNFSRGNNIDRNKIVLVEETLPSLFRDFFPLEFCDVLIVDFFLCLSQKHSPKRCSIYTWLLFSISVKIGNNLDRLVQIAQPRLGLLRQAYCD